MFVKLFSASLDFSTQANSRCGARHGRRVNLRSGAPSTEDPQRTPPLGQLPPTPCRHSGGRHHELREHLGGPQRLASRRRGRERHCPGPAPGARGAPQRRATPPRPGHAEIMCLFPETKTLAKWESTPRKRDCIEERDFSKVLPAHFVKGFGRKFFPWDGPRKSPATRRQPPCRTSCYAC